MEKQKVELVPWESVRRDMKYPKDDNNKGYIYGSNLLYGDSDNIDELEIVDVQWFKTNEERNKFIEDNDLLVVNEISL